MNKWLAYGCVLAVMAAPAFGQSFQRKPIGVARTAPDRTLKLLNQRIPEIQFQDTPLEQVMEWVTDFTQANVNVRWQILEDAGVAKDKAMSMKVRNLRLSQVLSMILSEAGGTDIKLAYRASGDLVTISTEEDLAKEMVTKVYDVSDLLLNIPRFSGEQQLDPGQGLAQGGGGEGGGGGGGGSGLFGQGNDDDNQDDEGQGGEAAQGVGMQQIILLITNTVEPDSWEMNGGGNGRIFPFRGSLVIRNTLLVHQQIGGYIRDQALGN